MIHSDIKELLKVFLFSEAHSGNSIDNTKLDKSARFVRYDVLLTLLIQCFRKPNFLLLQKRAIPGGPPLGRVSMQGQKSAGHHFGTPRQSESW